MVTLFDPWSFSTTVLLKNNTCRHVIVTTTNKISRKRMMIARVHVIFKMSEVPWSVFLTSHRLANVWVVKTMQVPPPPPSPNVTKPGTPPLSGGLKRRSALQARLGERPPYDKSATSVSGVRPAFTSPVKDKNSIQETIHNELAGPCGGRNTKKKKEIYE
jgi:hypothetical protein